MYHDRCKSQNVSASARHTNFWNNFKGFTRKTLKQNLKEQEFIHIDGNFMGYDRKRI